MGPGTVQRLVLFDIDGTLVRAGPAAALAFEWPSSAWPPAEAPG